MKRIIRSVSQARLFPLLGFFLLFSCGNGTDLTLEDYEQPYFINGTFTPDDPVQTDANQYTVDYTVSNTGTVPLEEIGFTYSYTNSVSSEPWSQTRLSDPLDPGESKTGTTVFNAVEPGTLAFDGTFTLHPRNFTDYTETEIQETGSFGGCIGLAGVSSEDLPYYGYPKVSWTFTNNSLQSKAYELTLSLDFGGGNPPVEVLQKSTDFIEWGKSDIQSRFVSFEDETCKGLKLQDITYDYEVFDWNSDYVIIYY
ncbi:MAG: hypothetical protein JW760_03220 [Spirochaetales bacterium]|nr:hypothetical protein [Spirochaetales bacterium]